jgi:hypothetical protein
MIVLNIDVTKLAKERFKTFKRRDGSEGISCDLILIETPNSEYGQWMVKQSMTKEERAAGLELPILGNAKNLERGGTRERPQPAERRPTATTTRGSAYPPGQKIEPAEKDDVPF